MAETAFTPGPWSVDDSGITASDGRTVAHISDGHVYDESDSDPGTLEFENPADARLVEAAPELYDLLSAGSVAMSPHERVRWIDRVRAKLDALEARGDHA